MSENHRDPDSSTGPGKPEPESAGASAAATTSPMDLICRRVLPRSPMVKPDAAGRLPQPGEPDLEEQRAEFVVQLPNPRYPRERPALHRHHDTTDILDAHCWGYGGSGPADLALNTLAAFLPATGKPSDVKLWDGSRVSAEAWRHHQDFKWAFIFGMGDDGGRVEAGVIREWIAQRVPATQLGEPGPKSDSGDGQPLNAEDSGAA